MAARPRKTAPRLSVCIPSDEYFANRFPDFDLVPSNARHRAKILIGFHEVDEPKAHYTTSGLPGYSIPTRVFDLDSVAERLAPNEIGRVSAAFPQDALMRDHLLTASQKNIFSQCSGATA